MTREELDDKIESKQQVCDMFRKNVQKYQELLEAWEAELKELEAERNNLGGEET